MTLRHDRPVARHAASKRMDNVYAAATVQSSRPLAPSAAGLVLLAILVPLQESWAVQAVLIPLLLILPGVILLRALRITGAAIAANPIYVPGASLVVLIGSGLAVDLIGPYLGIAEPLRAPPLLAGLEITCAVLLACSLRAGKETQIPWGELSRPLRLAWPLVLPLLGAAGALRLNAGHTGHVAALAIILVIGALSVSFLVASRIDDALLMVIIYAAALSMLWSFSLRGDLVYGFDIAKEYYELQQTVHAGSWHLYHQGDSYGAMLSLTVLPTELHSLSGMPALFIFKAVYPALSAFFPVAVFSISRRYLADRWAFLAAALVVIQQPFYQEFPALARQEIAMIFFAALISALLEKASTRRMQLTFVSLLSAAMVVSHYSTDYMTIALLGIAVAIQFTFSRFRLIPRVNGMMLTALCVCLGGAMLWYGMLTHSTSNVSHSLAVAVSNGLNILPDHSGNLLSTYLKGGQQSKMTMAQYQNYIAAYYRAHMPYVTPLPDATQLQYALRPAVDPTPASAWPLGTSALNLLSLLIQQLTNLLAGIGALLLLLSKKVPARVRQLGVIALAAMVILMLVRVSGTISQLYNPLRAFLQMLIVLGVAVCWPLSSLARRNRARMVTLAACAVSIAAFMAVSSSVDNAILGGSVSANLANKFDDYQYFVVSSQEIASASWLNRVSQPGEIIYADAYGELRLTTIVGDRPAIFSDITPETINGNSWVYASRTNVLNNIARSDMGNYFASYKFPKSFLDKNFNMVYTNGISEVFHR